ncbi:MAG: hypothetical protein V7K90_20310 [Nostoc sp.]
MFLASSAKPIDDNLKDFVEGIEAIYSANSPMQVDVIQKYASFVAVVLMK